MTNGITVRSVNRDLWRELKVAAVKEGITLGEAMNSALQAWLNEQKEVSRSGKCKNFWSLKPIKFTGEDKKKLSTLVDDTIYG